MKATKEYLRSCHGIVRLPLAYIIRKTIIVQTCGYYSRYATPDHEMITRILHLPPDKNTLLLEHNVHSNKEHRAEYKIDNITVYDIFDQI